MVVAARGLAIALGPDGFGLYSLAKRFLGLLVPIATLTIGVALPRELGRRGADADRDGVIIGGVILGILPGVLVAVACVVGAQILGADMLPWNLSFSMVAAISLSIVGQCCYAVLYAVYRGTGRMALANVWQFTLDGLVPVLVAWTWAKDVGVAGVLAIVAVSNVASGVPVAIWTRGAIQRGGLPVRHVIVELARYGVPRVPGSVAMAAMFAVGPMVAGWLLSVTAAGYIAAAQAVFVLAEAGVASFGLVALPWAAGLAASGQLGRLRKRNHDVLGFSTHVGMLASGQLWVWADDVVAVWLGDLFWPVGRLMRILALALVPYAWYVMYRSIVDAVDRQPINTRNLVSAVAIAVGCSVGLTVWGGGVVGCAVGPAAGFVWLGVSTVWYLVRKDLLVLQELQIVRCVVFNAIAVALAGVIRALVAERFGVGGTALIAVATGGVLSLAYWISLRRWAVGWVTEVERQVMYLGRARQ